MLRWAPAAGYVAITAGFFAPVASRLSRELVGHPGGDNAGSLWNAWWMSRSLLRFENPWWTDFLFAPDGTPLVWHSLAIIPATVVALLGTTVPLPLAYNLVLIAALPIAGVGGYALCKHLTDDVAASFVGGCVFMLCPFIASKTLGHIDLAYAGLVAFFFVALLRAIMREGRGRWALAGVSMLVLFGSSPNAAIFAANLTFFLFIWHVRGGSLSASTRLFLRALAPTLLLALPYVCVVVGYSLVYGVAPDPRQDLAYNPELISFVLPFTVTSMHSAWPRSVAPGLAGAEPAAYLGIAIFPMAVAGLVLRRRDPLSIHLALVALVFLVFSLGPKLLHQREVVEVAGTAVYLPFGLWRWVPVLGAVGQAGRYMIIVYLVMAVGVAHAVVWARARWGSAAVVIATGVVCADFALQPVLGPLPETLQLSPSAPSRMRVLDPRLGSADTMYQQTQHQRELVGGYISRPNDRAITRYRDDPVLAWFFAGNAPAPSQRELVVRLRELAVGDVLLAPNDPRAATLARYDFRRTSENAYTVVWSRPD